MSSLKDSAFGFGGLIAGSIIAGMVGLTTVAGAAGYTDNGISEPGLLMQSEALFRPAPATSRPVVQTDEAPSVKERRKAAWEDCEPGSYWIMEGVDNSVPILCR